MGLPQLVLDRVIGNREVSCCEAERMVRLAEATYYSLDERQKSGER